MLVRSFSSWAGKISPVGHPVLFAIVVFGFLSLLEYNVNFLSRIPPVNLPDTLNYGSTPTTYTPPPPLSSLSLPPKFQPTVVVHSASIRPARPAPTEAVYQISAPIPPSLKTYTISAGNIEASFIAFGARLTSLLIPDRTGIVQDVVVGYDDPFDYVRDTATKHTYFGPIVGRYANRIRNGTFTIKNETYHVPRNEHMSSNTLHGGVIGYDARNWTVESYGKSSITFTLLDEGFEGFPGSVLTKATYSVEMVTDEDQGKYVPRLTCTMISQALDKPTPIMLANHIYWNLNAFKNPTVLDDTTVWLPYSHRYINVDNQLIPDGHIYGVSNPSALNFTTPRLLADAISQASGVCGPGCTGIDQDFVIDHPQTDDTNTTFTYKYSTHEISLNTVLSMWSNTTGIRMDMSTNQIGTQIYTCNNLDGTIPIKPSQKKRNKEQLEQQIRQSPSSFSSSPSSSSSSSSSPDLPWTSNPYSSKYGDDESDNLDLELEAEVFGKSRLVTHVMKHGCVVIEPQSWIDGINHPEWGVEDYQIFSQDTGPAINVATYDFSIYGEHVFG